MFLFLEKIAIFLLLVIKNILEFLADVFTGFIFIAACTFILYQIIKNLFP